LLRRQIKKGEELLKGGSIAESDYNAWQTLSNEVVVKAFGRNTDKHYSYAAAGPGAVVIVNQQSPAWYENRRRNRLTAKVEKLAAFVSVLELEIEVATPIQPANLIPLSSAPHNSDIFIVHGHDVHSRDEVSKFLEKLRLRPIILHEQPNKGRTIIEKFTDNTDVGFAVVLLTADDRGGAQADSVKSQKARARQNVIFELGFFVGKLGRNRVCALYQQGVEIPSDYAGVVYIPLDEAGAWRLALARELRSAEYDIDMNRAV
jgi:predicted nucleotide-binding protein